MEARDFCYWLHGFFEITDRNNLTELEIRIIRAHLKLVMAPRVLIDDQLVPVGTTADEDGIFRVTVSC